MSIIGVGLAAMGAYWVGLGVEGGRVWLIITGLVVMLIGTGMEKLAVLRLEEMVKRVGTTERADD